LLSTIRPTGLDSGRPQPSMHRADLRTRAEFGISIRGRLAPARRDRGICDHLVAIDAGGCMRADIAHQLHPEPGSSRRSGGGPSHSVQSELPPRPAGHHRRRRGGGGRCCALAMDRTPTYWVRDCVADLPAACSSAVERVDGTRSIELFRDGKEVRASYPALRLTAGRRVIRDQLLCGSTSPRWARVQIAGR